MGAVIPVPDSYRLSFGLVCVWIQVLDPFDEYWIHHARPSSQTSRSLDVLAFLENYYFIFSKYIYFCTKGIMNLAPVSASPPRSLSRMPNNSSPNAKNAFDRLKQFLVGNAGFAVSEMKEMSVPQLCLRATTSFLEFLSKLKIANVATEDLFCEQLTDAEVTTICDCLKCWVKEGKKNGQSVMTG